MSSLCVPSIFAVMAPVHKGPYEAIGVYLLSGFLLAKGARAAIKRNERQVRLQKV
jgi:hypothetical protein